MSVGGLGGMSGLGGADFYSQLVNQQRRTTALDVQDKEKQEEEARRVEESSQEQEQSAFFRVFEEANRTPPRDVGETAGSGLDPARRGKTDAEDLLSLLGAYAKGPDAPEFSGGEAVPFAQAASAESAAAGGVGGVMSTMSGPAMMLQSLVSPSYGA